MQIKVLFLIARESLSFQTLNSQEIRDQALFLHLPYFLEISQNTAPSVCSECSLFSRVQPINANDISSFSRSNKASFSGCQMVWWLIAKIRSWLRFVRFESVETSLRY